MKQIDIEDYPGVRRYSRCGSEYTLNKTEKFVLEHIRREGEITAKELREDTQISRGYLVKIVWSLHDIKKIKTIARGKYAAL